ncbi:MAG: AMP-dependent synthetase and ligase [Modestobacter sp.]|jgi:cyclohexanecarboxylate-CoA ligase|nr:AMP-dependent synthetase and ligase [Modestobacter sp.]MCW2619436.1 AMP-dependent synthetase and ligase [Modestobacter sp.]
MSFETILTAEQVERYTAEGLWTGRLITDFLDEVAAADPDKLAAIDARGRTTYGELKRLSDRAALGLLELGVRPGDVVSFQLPNWTEFLVLHFALTRIGAVNNPLIPIYRDREVGFMVALARSTVIVVPQEFRGYDYPGMVQRLRGDWPDLRHVLVVDGPTTDSQTSWQEFIETPWEERRDPAELDALRPDPDDVTLLIFTSGTTGEPKGVMHTHNTLVAANAPLPERLGVGRDSVVHMASTFAHLTGFLYGVRLPTQVGGATAVYQDVWDPARFVDLVEQHRISYTSAATPFLHDTLQVPGLDARDVSSLRLFCCMGAPIPRAIMRQARRALPRLTVLGGWGQSENGLVTLGIPGDPEEKLVERDGYPWPGMEIRVVGFAGEPLEAGQEGRLQVRGPFLFVGYAERLEMTRASFDGDWFETGDLASIDAEGYLNITGRTKDVIIRGGENIPVAYIENVLYEHPSLTAVAVVGVPDPRLQERACAVVTLVPGVDSFTLAEMRVFLDRKGVSRHYWPESLEVVGELPRTASGKIQKFQLRDRLAAQA